VKEVPTEQELRHGTFGPPSENPRDYMIGEYESLTPSDDRARSNEWGVCTWLERCVRDDGFPEEEITGWTRRNPSERHLRIRHPVLGDWDHVRGVYVRHPDVVYSPDLEGSAQELAEVNRAKCLAHLYLTRETSDEGYQRGYNDGKKDEQQKAYRHRTYQSIVGGLLVMVASEITRRI
jgi:hypothetical protein